MPEYKVTIRYRTATGANGATMRVTAPNEDEAYAAVCRKVRRTRAVMQIDGGDVEEITNG